MLKRVTTTCMVLCLALPTFSASTSAHSILRAATSDHTDFIKDEEYIAAPAVLFMVLGVDDVASGSVECEDGGLEILYEEPGPPELDGVEEEPVQPELTGVEEGQITSEMISVEEALEEIELEEIINDEIQIP